MFEENKKINSYFLYWIIAFSFLLRLISVYFFRDLDLNSSNVNEWNILLENLIKYKTYAFYVFNGEAIPSAYMPPIYPFFLYIIKIITNFDSIKFLYAVIFTQIILSTYSVYLFYQINQKIFSNRLSLISSIIFSVIPLNIYICGQISSVNLQIIFSLLFLKFLLILLDKKENSNIVFFSIISGLLILTRGEFILIFIIIIFFSVLNKKINLINFAKITLIVSLIISPYIIRNYVHFNQFFLLKSLGFNLWKGNNEMSSVQGYENFYDGNFKKLEFKIKNLEKNKYYEINKDKIFLKYAKNNLLDDPIRYLNLFFKKLFSYYFIDLESTYPKYYNFFNIFPSTILGLLSFFGLYFFLKKKSVKHNYLLLYLFSNILIFAIFFILPRYKLIILPVQIIIAVDFINNFLEKKKRI